MGSMANIKKLLTLNCEDAARLLSNRQDSELTRGERWGLKMHLLICRSCRRYKGQLGFMRRLFTTLKNDPNAAPPDLRMSDEKLDQIKKILQDKDPS